MYDVNTNLNGDVHFAKRKFKKLIIFLHFLFNIGYLKDIACKIHLIISIAKYNNTPPITTSATNFSGCFFYERNNAAYAEHNHFLYIIYKLQNIHYTSIAS